jgi:hypothetical protein
MTTMDDSSLQQSIKELKHSVKFHLAMAGGPSAGLCMYMLKSVDIIDNMLNNAIDKADEEAMLVASEIVKSVAENVRDAINKYASEGQLSEEIIKAGSALSESIEQDWGMSPVRQVDYKNLLLSQINIALQSLSEHTDVKYPLVTYSDGNEL